MTALTDLTQQSVHRIIEGLIADGLLVTERGKPNGRQAEASAEFEQHRRYSMGVALDVNGISISVVDFTAVWLRIRKWQLRLPRMITGFRFMLDACEAISSKTTFSRQTLCGFGVALGTVFERQCSIACYRNCLRCWATP